MKTIAQLRLIGADTLEADGKRYACAIGRDGVTAEKREGDLKTPAGSFPLRCCYYRPDRIDPAPVTRLPLTALSPDDGWCDDPAHPMYNKPVKLPFDGHHEKLWRDDHLYDLIVPLGYNDDPVVPGKGSAIFLHLMRADGGGTEGCVAMEKETLLELLARTDTSTHVIIAVA